MANKSFQDLFDSAKDRLSYQVEKAKLDFLVSVNRLIREKDASKKEIATSMGCSPSGLSRILGGEQNFTIETMVRLARAVDGEVHIHVARKGSRVHWVEEVLTPVAASHAPVSTEQRAGAKAWIDFIKHESRGVANA